MRQRKKSFGKNTKNKPVSGKSNRNTGGRVEAPYPHFRYYKKTKHPALIVGEQPVEEYKFRKVMHSEKDGGRNNEKVYPNPDKRDSSPMYICKSVRHDKKNTFEEKPLPWKYPKK